MNANPTGADWLLIAGVIGLGAYMVTRVSQKESLPNPDIVPPSDDSITGVSQCRAHGGRWVKTTLGAPGADSETWTCFPISGAFTL